MRLYSKALAIHQAPWKFFSYLFLHGLTLNLTPAYLQKFASLEAIGFLRRQLRPRSISSLALLLFSFLSSPSRRFLALRWIPPTHFSSLPTTVSLSMEMGTTWFRFSFDLLFSRFAVSFFLRPQNH